MVTHFALFTMLLLAQPADVSAPPSPADAPVREALKEGGYSWYDSSNDSLHPVQPPWTSSWLKRMGDWLDQFNFKWTGPKGNVRFDLGQFLTILLFVVLLALLLIGLYYAYRAYAPTTRAAPIQSKVGAAAHVGGLPVGLQIDLTDPLGEARRLRAAGDYAAATLCLFVHLLITLQETQYIRLAPGKTGRQLVRSITDGWIRARVEPTLRLFESSYYGHRLPSESAFEYAWTQAELLEERFGRGAGK